MGRRKRVIEPKICENCQQPFWPKSDQSGSIYAFKKARYCCVACANIARRSNPHKHARQRHNQRYDWRVHGDSIVLTRRERDVLTAILAGYTTDQALTQVLSIERSTMRVYLTSMLRKVEASNKTELVLWAWHNGWPLPGNNESARSTQEALNGQAFG